MTRAATPPAATPPQQEGTRSPCDTCAFREGSITHDSEPYNRFRGQICALAGLPFLCHHGLNWRKPVFVRRGIAADAEGNSQPMKVCEGWRTEVARNIKPDTKNRMIRRGLGQLCLDTLEVAVSETDVKEKAELWAELGRTFKMLLKAANLKITRPKKTEKEVCV